MAATILIADSDITTLELATAVLIRNGLLVTATNDGGDALARFLEGRPAVVICDQDLQTLSGAQLCRQIRGQAPSARLLLLVSPGAEATALTRLAEELGCDAVLPRPFRFGPVRELLCAWRVLDTEQSAANAAAAPLTFTLPSPPPLIAPALPMVEVASAGELATVQPPAPSDAPLPIPIPMPLPAVEPEDELEIDTTAFALQDAQAQREAQRLAVLPSSVPPHGDLTSMPLPRLLFELYVNTFSGKVHLKRRELKRTIYLWAGLPVRVDSEQLAESLGVLLREAGRISEAQCDEAQRLAMEQHQPLGEALVQMGAIRRGELLAALAEQTERKLINTFAWRDGTFRLEVDTAFAEETVFTEIPPLRVIVRGIHEHYELSALMGFFSRHAQRYIVVTDLYAVQLENVEPLLKNFDILPLLDGQTTFEAALRSNDEHALSIAQVLYTMLVTDMIGASTTPGRGAAAEAERRPPAVVAAAPINYQHLMELADRIAGEYLQLKSRSHFQLLEVETCASVEEIHRGHQEVCARLQRWLATAGLPHEAIKRAREILEAVEKAYAVLTDPHRAAMYHQQLAGGATTAADGDLSLAVAGESDVVARRREALFAAELFYKEGLRLLEMLDPRGARQQFEKALKTNPAEPTYRVAIAQAVLLERQSAADRGRGEAFIYLEDALRIDPSHLLANLEAAKLFIAEGLPLQARPHLERVIKKAPHHQQARKLLDELSDRSPVYNSGGRTG